jgi:hypothetical protein
MMMRVIGDSEPGERDLLREWQAALGSLVSAGGRADLPRQVHAPLERQTELVLAVLERERRLQQDLLVRAFGPFDALFHLLEQSADALRSQAVALAESARALDQAAAMAERQAELLERTVAVLREPGEMIRCTAGVDREREPR